jgi:pimeloyl-ACP methyl ester carboxylesterase
VAPDLRGYGGSDAPAAAGPQQYTALHVVGDLVALVDSLGHDRVFVVAHDWGAILAWHLCLFRPDKVIALVAMSVPFIPRDPVQTPVGALRSLYGDEYYVCRFQEPGAMEAEFARLGTELVLRKFLAMRTADPLFIPYSGWGSPEDEVPLPSWI